MGWLKLLLNTGTADGMDFVPAGTFQFKFPVRIPVDQPAQTEWYFSLCESYACIGHNDESVITTFPIPNTSPVKPAKVFGTGRVAMTADALHRVAMIKFVWFFVCPSFMYRW